MSCHRGRERPTCAQLIAGARRRNINIRSEQLNLGSLTYRKSIERFRRQSAIMRSPKTLTILIPVYNGAKYLAGLLKSFEAYIGDGDDRQAFLKATEILVINNCSEDETLAVAQSFEKSIPNLQVITPSKHVPSAEEN